MEEPAFQAEGLVKRFGKTVALDGVDLSAAPGTVLAVLGPNGAGKTTAVRILATLARPDAGSARVGGFDVVREAARVRRLIGLAGQSATVDEELTGRGNLELIGRLLDLRRGAARARAAELLDRFGLAGDADRPVSGYSGGMRRRLDLAASLVGRPRVVFLDEPTTGLDPGRREELWRMVREVTAEGATVLLTTQYLEEADALADDIRIIDRGRVIAQGTPAELKRVVGGQAVSVRPGGPDHMDAAAAVLASVTGRAPERTGRTALSAPVEDADTAWRVAEGLRARNVPVIEFSLHLPSLDEVFFALTGDARHRDEEPAA
ncbi:MULTISPECIES: ATP-binding cassette domain-containing protein [Nocardiopsis]|uniref:ATP-binding cassette domain-containing protein n=1 Tax=Nocardiopsis changdeensis TaxID=2831969 RepID=A0ABX8BR16_9ACTN|nr:MULTISPECIES: ATP-binding cassette domain-containing protein [Nocardiopsis]QUX24677.1 ATP-binding cassette domain-containing protein [Nocardiopsis changdeensis]QYX35065.1 ATP-binding cassette domain-containing protein [Nocardiopsis sp. MT53]